MGRWAIVEEDSDIANVAVWDGKTEWEAPEDTTSVEDPNGKAAPGGRYENGAFLPPITSPGSEEPPYTKRTEFRTGATDANGEVKFTFSEPFLQIPHVTPEMLPAPDNFAFVRVTAISENSVTVSVRKRQGLEVLNLTVLSSATTPVSGVTVSIKAEVP